jgi:hypothetical protein
VEEFSMNPPAILSNHHAIGAALVLYEYLAAQTTPRNEQWLAVAGGIWVSIEQLAYRLDTTAPTIERWRKRLERYGYIHSEKVRPRFRKFWIANEKAWPRELSQLQAPATSFVN